MGNAPLWKQPLARPGDPVRLGVDLGHAMEPEMRWGRLVAIFKDGRPPINRHVVREFVEGDDDFPTGGYRTTAFLVPWTGNGPLFCPPPFWKRSEAAP